MQRKHPNSEEKVTLKILVDKKINEVVFAEAGKDFVDILLSFLTFPLGTIARIVSNDSNMPKVSVGSLSSLYQSVANLDVSHFSSETCKEMLLHPRNSSEDYSQNIKLNIDDTEKTKYFICEDWECNRQGRGGLLSIFRNTRCKCGKLMNREILQEKTSLLNMLGFVHDESTFIIFDNLSVIADNDQSGFYQPKNFGYKYFNAMKVVPVNITQKEIVDLLKISLLSKTPLTDFFLRREVFNMNLPKRDTRVFNDVRSEPCDEGYSSLKVMRRKSSNKILFALAGDDFIDILLSFLTFPLGGVENILQGKSCLRSIDNLYKSVVVLDPIKDFKSPNLKDKLVNSRIAQQFKLQNQIFLVEEDPIVEYCFNTKCFGFANNVSNLYLTTAPGYLTLDGYPFSSPLVYVNPLSES
ncbi:hypothetical protein Lalb_Chr03g0042891 [Lupinus albus]|uniref:DUF674 family protein n=1 Tax=Lupinus albus TaxID=3870 RepID=A0A6A4QUR7_LUPAL|nr:hypothetical protein Lalb_Chr03g0042891 [Lupinus albus]